VQQSTAMSRLLLTLTMTLAFLPASRADDVTVDVAKLTDFTTSFSFKAKDLLVDVLRTGGSGMRTGGLLYGSTEDVRGLLESDLTVEGKLIANIPGEKMKIKLDLSAQAPSPVFPMNSKATIVLTFDGPKGYVAVENAGSLNAPHGELTGVGCVKGKFDSRMIPPPERLKKRIDEQAPMARMMANMRPHAVKGDLAYYMLCIGGCAEEGPGPGPDRAPGASGDTVLALHVSDGTPAAFWGLGTITEVENAANLVQGLTPAIKFGDFTEAEDFSEVQCTTQFSNIQMLDEPRSKQALFLAEQLLKRLQLATPLAPVFGHVFAQFPQVLRNPDNSCASPAEATNMQAATPVEPLGFFGFAAVVMVSAAVGAGIAVAAARHAFSKTEAVYLEIS